MKKIALISVWSIIGLFLLGPQVQIAYGTVEPGWSMGTPNVCRQSTDGFIDFENDYSALVGDR